MANTYDVDILCGYVMKTFQHEPERHIYERICRALSGLFTRHGLLSSLKSQFPPILLADATRFWKCKSAKPQPQQTKSSAGEPKGGLVQSFPFRQMNVNLRAKLCHVFRLTRSRECSRWKPVDTGNPRVVMSRWNNRPSITAGDS